MVVEPMASRPAGANGRTAQGENRFNEATVAARGARRSRRALIVDDEPDIVEILSSLVEEVGWTALPAFGPEEALRLAAAAPFDLLLCDICLPRMDGVELMRRLQAAALIGDATVVLMSAARRRAPDGVRFLAKPFDLDDVVALLDGLGGD
ncbi:MAG TPA: response regulator [Thermomicrobiales bacterium]|nr:response regulator [Thermomicrobiales bacterium]